MAATLASGKSTLHNVAIEPEIDALVDYLIQMGLKLRGRGTRTLVIEGVEKLNPGSGATIPDRIEAGTYLIGAAMTRGCIKTTKMNPSHIEALLSSLRENGM